MRLFIAIDIPENIKEKILEIQRRLDKKEFDIKFVELENLHITLKFLGEVHEDKINEIKERVYKIAKNFYKFKINLQGFGYFGSEKYIKVLWIDVKDNKEKLIKLMNLLNRELENIKMENYPLNPHLTVGRVRSGKNKEKLLFIVKNLHNVKIGEVYVKEIKLKQSILTKHGPVYKDIERFVLGEENG